MKEIRLERQSFWMIGLTQLKNEIGDGLKQKLIKGVLGLIEKDRRDEKRMHRDLIAKLIHVMLALNFYKGSFEEEFLTDTK